MAATMRPYLTSSRISQRYATPVQQHLGAQTQAGLLLVATCTHRHALHIGQRTARQGLLIRSSAMAGDTAAGANGASSPSPATTSAAAAAAATAARPAADWEQEIQELQKLIALLPISVQAAVEDHQEMTDLMEVVLDLGRPPLARFPSGDVKLSTNPVTREDLDYAVAQVGDFGGDNRAGIDRTLHRISCIRNRRGAIIGLTCRVGRAIWGSAEMVRDLVTSGASVLFLGRPGVGKTTAIREVSRTLSDVLLKRVVIVDTSNEIGGDGDIPHDGIGRARRMQVQDPELQHRVMVEAVENHMPEVIIIDEIGTEAECVAARTIAQRGVQLVATAHGNELENVIKNPALSDLVGGIQSVTLGDEEARRRGVQKSVLERAAPPTFDVAVEMVERDKWRVHLDVAQSVDVLLAGGQPGGQVRERTSDDAILKYSFNPQMPTVVFQAKDMPGAGGPGGGPGKKLGRREAEREARLRRRAEAGGGSRHSNSNGGSNGGYSSDGDYASTSSWSFDEEEGESGASASFAAGPSGRSSPSTSSFVRSPMAQQIIQAQMAAAAEMGDFQSSIGPAPDERDELSCRKAWKLRQRQAAAGVHDDDWGEAGEGEDGASRGGGAAEGSLLRLFPFDLDPERLWEVMLAMGLVDKLLIVYNVNDADAVLGLRSRVRSASALRQASKAAGVPIYAIKNVSTASLVKALRTLLGLEPSAGGSPLRLPTLRAPASPSFGSSPTVSSLSSFGTDASVDLGEEGGYGGAWGGAAASASAYGSVRGGVAGAKSAALDEALEEAVQAIEAIVLPLQQPVELMPRTGAVLEAQVALAKRYGLASEQIGSGPDARLRLIPQALVKVAAGSGAGAGAASGMGSGEGQSSAASA